MSDCEYIKLCEKAFGATVPGCRNDHWRGCPNYDLCVLVHNQAIEKAIIEVDDGEWQDCVELRMKVEALRKPASQEGE